MKILLLLLLNLLSINTLASSEEFTVNTRNANTIVYRGEIVKGSYDAIKKMITNETQFLEISSFGGDSAEAMKIGREIRHRNIHLEVKSYCFSSCANYLFLAAKTKSVALNSFLGFHGATSPTLTAQELSDYKLGKLKASLVPQPDLKDPKFVQESIKKAAIQELDFLTEIDVDTNFFFAMNNKIKKIKLPDINASKKKLEQKIIITTKNKTWEQKMDDFDESQLNRIVADLTKRKINFEITLFSRISKFGNAGYFPSLVFLESLSVKGVNSFFYPVTSTDFQKLTSEIFGADFVALSDFSIE